MAQYDDAPPPGETPPSAPDADAEATSDPTGQAVAAVPDATRILAGLRAGMTDDAIARELGISGRTLNRRIALLMDAVGARSRFQLGTALALARIVAPPKRPAETPPSRAGRAAMQPHRLRQHLERHGMPMRATVWLWIDDAGAIHVH